MLSDYLGYACIACWLGAQFPQVIENIRLKSCDGLALPFLANWLLGDISNLIGCILTHQLPFQTWLATYFVLVDLTLVGQYVYYQYISPKPVKTRVVRRYSIDRATPRYRTLSVVAANVAAAAALAAQDGSETPRASARWPRTGRLDDEPEEEDYGPLADSFHSEGGRDIGRKRVSWSVERPDVRTASIGRYALPRSALLPPMRMASSTIEPADSRGRSLRREVDVIPSSDPPPSASTRQSRASRRGANMVFLGAFALFSIGAIAGSRRSLEPTTHLGRVLSSSSSILSEFPPVATGTPGFFDDPLKDHPHHEPPPSNPAFNERVLGRIFAWLCTTLYLTSRLPQIWKNFVRKSVEGLSMYLFMFAFLGNSFYVASIITSPKFYAPPPASTEFIRESIPYILGSAGTLMFDVTILTQSVIYRPKPRHRHRHRVDASTVEEQAGLLSASAQPPYHSSESVVHSRGRTSSTPRDTVE